MIVATRSCIQCGKPLTGRADQRFCSTNCKNKWHQAKYKAAEAATKAVDDILHQNREILLRMLDGKMTRTVSRNALELQGFRFAFMTGYRKDEADRLVHQVYELLWFAAGPDHITLRQVIL
ncbi:MAG: DUF2116 family Zn-ribbon domain-containing protein [Bacteroidota bacterium]